MSIASPLVWLSLMMSLFFLLLPVALLVVLQVWLCKKSKKLGLILPILSLAVSLLLVLSMGALQMVTTAPPMVTGGNELVVSGSSQVPAEEGEPTSLPAQEAEDLPEERQVNLTPGALGAIAGVFLVSNIPTVVFGGIWLYYKNRRDFKDDLKRMRIEDLE